MSSEYMPLCLLKVPLSETLVSAFYFFSKPIALPARQVERKLKTGLWTNLLAIEIGELLVFQPYSSRYCE